MRSIKIFNDLAVRECAEGKGPYKYREVKVIMAAPKDFLPAERIIDYDGDVSRDLIEQGHNAAKQVFEDSFPA